jgi:hypothetical protein
LRRFLPAISTPRFTSSHSSLLALHERSEAVSVVIKVEKKLFYKIFFGIISPLSFCQITPEPPFLVGLEANTRYGVDHKVVGCKFTFRETAVPFIKDERFPGCPASKRR